MIHSPRAAPSLNKSHIPRHEKRKGRGGERMKHCCAQEGKDESCSKDDDVGVTRNDLSPRPLFHH